MTFHTWSQWESVVTGIAWLPVIVIMSVIPRMLWLFYVLILQRVLFFQSNLKLILVIYHQSPLELAALKMLHYFCTLLLFDLFDNWLKEKIAPLYTVIVLSVLFVSVEHQKQTREANRNHVWEIQHSCLLPLQEFSSLCVSFRHQLIYLFFSVFNLHPDPWAENSQGNGK